MRRIAVVGSGISGLGAAWALARVHDVTVFEAQGRPGGHANTVRLAQERALRAVDTGFLVYNHQTYPHLVRLFDHLGVASERSDMSFAVSMDDGRVEYAGSPRGLFVQKRNVLRPRFWSMVRDILRFYREAPAWLAAHDGHDGPSMGDYLRAGGYGRAFVDDHLAPMAAAIWSCPDAEVLDFPAKSLLQFLNNHGLLQVRDRPQWRTVQGGSQHYVRAITDALAGRVHCDSPVAAVRRDPTGVALKVRGDWARFDDVVIATHADQALAILGDAATADEHDILGAFRYSANDAWLHSDPALMPRRRRAWASWNYLGRTNARDAGTRAVSVTYWLNRLQNLPAPDLFVSLNPHTPPADAHVHTRMTYDHPILDAAACAAQDRVAVLQGVHNTWYCGSHVGYGFHEDGLESGFAVADELGAPVPWRDAVTPASPADRRARPRPAATTQAAA
jgi:hypothetical protein